MKNALFNELVLSIRQAGAIMRGEAPASRTVVIAKADVKRMRGKPRGKTARSRRA